MPLRYFAVITYRVCLFSPAIITAIHPKNPRWFKLKGTGRSFLVNKQSCLRSAFPTKTHYVQPWGVTSMFNAFPSSFAKTNCGIFLTFIHVFRAAGSLHPRVLLTHSHRQRTVVGAPTAWVDDQTILIPAKGKDGGNCGCACKSPHLSLPWDGRLTFFLWCKSHYTTHICYPPPPPH